MAKLDPDNIKSAKDVMDERAAAALKRKREERSPGEAVVHISEKPQDEIKADHPKTKKRKVLDDEDSKARSGGQETKDEAEESEEQKRRRKAEHKAAKRERKKARAARTKEKRERQRMRKEEPTTSELQLHIDNADEDDGVDNVSEEDVAMVDGLGIDEADPSLQMGKDESTTSPSPVAESLTLSPNLHSGTSSISSIQPPSEPTISKPLQGEPSSTHELSKSDDASSTPKERLEARLNELRVARKADGPHGRPARNRQELLEARRKKEEDRRAQKKEQRRKAKEEEARKQEEEIARRFSPGGSGSLLASPRSPMESGNNFSFGRVSFGDGTQADATLSSLVDQRKQKGPADPATALKSTQNKASRLSGLDEAKRANIEQKDMWLNAKKRAHGERVRDDTSLLKKALKRQESTKKKSEKDWQGRIEGVGKGQDMRQRRREDNIRKRREEKGSKGKKAKPKKVKRPGFEGSFKGRTGGGKKH